LLTDARATNYGVVRLELIEELYETMYDQRREIGTDEKQWPHRILAGRQIKSIEPRDDDSLELRVQSLEDVLAEGFQDEEEIFQADLVIAATGYQRTAHVDILRGAWDLLPKAAPTKGAELRKGIAGWNVETEQGERKLAVGRDYKVRFAPGSVADDSGVWLQGCCEGTHGVSLAPCLRRVYLSILALTLVHTVVGHLVVSPRYSVRRIGGRHFRKAAMIFFFFLFFHFVFATL
jgi:L-ornithine N5-monooxygenase